MTNDFLRRWRQHIGDIKGGAKYTTRKGRDWYPICIIDGFETMKEAMQCEWRLKRNRNYRSPLIKEQNLTIYIDDDYSHIFKSYPTKQLYWK